MWYRVASQKQNQKYLAGSAIPKNADNSLFNQLHSLDERINILQKLVDFSKNRLRSFCVSFKINYLIKLIITFAPIAILLEGFNLWYTDNRQFFNFVMGALFINKIVGVFYHIKMHSFNWVQFFRKNGIMWCVLIITYILLEMIVK